LCIPTDAVFASKAAGARHVEVKSEPAKKGPLAIMRPGQIRRMWNARTGQGRNFEMALCCGTRKGMRI
jgi:hypothetical protein